nr:hypothetical protein 4 [Pseudomonadaceae bacterium]
MKLWTDDKDWEGVLAAAESDWVCALVNVHEDLECVKEERDQLAARVERLEHPATVLMENMQETIELLGAIGAAPNIVALINDLNFATDELVDALNETPSASLARVKAEAIREAIKYSESKFGGLVWPRELESYAQRLIDEAEGE